MSFTSFKDKVSQYGNKPVIGVIHVGAHFGSEYNEYKNMNINNMLFFEPVPQTFNILKQTVPENFIVNKGAGNFNGTVDMFIETANNGQSSSIMEPVIHTQFISWNCF